MHLYFMNEALKEANKARKKNEVPVGAVVTKNGEILSRAHNLRENKKDALAHAELLAILKACKKLSSWRLEGCEVYITLEPCPMCAGALFQARVKAVYYGVSDPKAGVVSLGIPIHNNPQLNHRYPLTCLNIKECGNILSSFFARRRKESK